MTELTFLVELLLNHKLQKSTRDIIASRLKEVEEGFVMRGIPAQSPVIFPSNLGQAPSTLAAMARHSGSSTTINIAASEPSIPVAVVAQTPAAVQAMNSRQQAINESMAGKVDKSTGRPRKF